MAYEHSGSDDASTQGARCGEGVGTNGGGRVEEQ